MTLDRQAQKGDVPSLGQVAELTRLAQKRSRLLVGLAELCGKLFKENPEFPKLLKFVEKDGRVTFTFEVSDRVKFNPAVLAPLTQFLNPSIEYSTLGIEVRGTLDELVQFLGYDPMDVDTIVADEIENRSHNPLRALAVKFVDEVMVDSGGRSHSKLKSEYIDSIEILGRDERGLPDRLVIRMDKRCGGMPYGYGSGLEGVTILPWLSCPNGVEINVDYKRFKEVIDGLYGAKFGSLDSQTDTTHKRVSDTGVV